MISRFLAKVCGREFNVEPRRGLLNCDFVAESTVCSSTAMDGLSQRTSYAKNNFILAGKVGHSAWWVPFDDTVRLVPCSHAVHPHCSAEATASQ
jgi:hypothetical protein